MKISGWIEKIRGPKKNKAAEKRAKFEEKFGPPGFVEFVHAYGCVVEKQSGSADGCLGAIEVAHVKSRGAGGTWKNGTVGLCTAHHREQHSFGIKTFAARHNLDLDLWACAVTHKWDMTQ